MLHHNMEKETSKEMKMFGLTKDSFGVGRDVNLILKWINTQHGLLECDRMVKTSIKSNAFE